MAQLQNLTITLNLSVFDSSKKTHNFIGRLNTQADTNFISPQSVEFLKHPVEVYQGGDFDGAGDGDLKPRGQVSIFLRWNESTKNKLHKETFLVLESLPYDFVLGNTFLTKNDVYESNGKLLPMALKPLSEEEKKALELQEQAAKAQQEVIEKAEAAKRKEEREKQRQALNQAKS
ncbi:hypothetical protein BKA67DRAFT_536575 [Truncatella angustata]|uniref:Uncharacterized protein n=1 Tax=Truncatella angustata TaxID=152316 RepID=A0A9P8ZX95_9PEZI|nr:uncharacterized protein BKA67DRAFT_536575 [Truncatella angustata]KAH6652863.1 hypothetical protein BKA67DRAFT_536575 [Truncatella angustata]